MFRAQFLLPSYTIKYLRKWPGREILSDPAVSLRSLTSKLASFNSCPN